MGGVKAAGKTAHEAAVKAAKEKAAREKASAPKPPSQIDTSRVRQTQATEQLEATGRGLLSRNVDVPTVGPIDVTTAQAPTASAAQLGDIQGMDQLAGVVNQAQQAYRQSGDVNINRFLNALMQSGQATPEALQMAQAAAQGQGPSAAQAQLQAGLDQSIAAQMAAGASGGGGAAALRGAQQQAGLMQQQAANQAAQLRAQEQQQAMALFGNLATQQDQLAAQRAAQAGGLSLGAQELSGAQQQQALQTLLAGAGQQAGLGLEAASTQAGLQQQANLANLDAGTRVALANQMAANQASQLGAQLGMEGQLAALGAEQAYAGMGAGLLGQGLGARTGRLGTEMDFLLGQQGLQAQRRAQDIAKREADRAFWGQILGGVIGAGGAVGAAALSDERAKTDISANDATGEFLAALTDNKYKYKDPSMKGAAEGEQFGPMAQDLAKTKMGRTAIVDMGGYMGVDPSRAVLLALSGLSNIHGRLEKLEGK